jgi:hypothetical protein
MSDSESTAKERLVTLLDYADEVSKLNTRTSEEDSSLQLLGGFEFDEGKAIVLHEDVLLRLAEVKDDGSGVPCCHFATPSAPSSRAGVWMRLSRPDSTEVRDVGAGKLLCSIYASLYSTHQEALREGRGAQVTAGVGILRWKRASDGKIIDLESHHWKTQWSRARMDQYPMVEYNIQNGSMRVMTSVKKHPGGVMNNQSLLVRGMSALKTQKAQAATYH